MLGVVEHGVPVAYKMASLPRDVETDAAPFDEESDSKSKKGFSLKAFSKSKSKDKKKSKSTPPPERNDTNDVEIRDLDSLDVMAAKKLQAIENDTWNVQYDASCSSVEMIRKTSDPGGDPNESYVSTVQEANARIEEKLQQQSETYSVPSGWRDKKSCPKTKHIPRRESSNDKDSQANQQPRSSTQVNVSPSGHPSYPVNATDMEIELKPHHYKDMPRKLKTPNADVFLISSDTDKYFARKLQELMQGLEFRLNIHSETDKRMEKCRVYIWEDMHNQNSIPDCIAEAQEMCTYVFVLLTDNFLNDKMAHFQKDDTLVRSITDDYRRWGIVPIYTQPKKEKKDKRGKPKRCTYYDDDEGDNGSRFPSGLVSFKGLDMSRLLKGKTNGIHDCKSLLDGDHYFQRGLIGMLETRSSERMEREEARLAKKREWEEKKRQELRREMLIEQQRKRMMMQAQEEQLQRELRDVARQPLPEFQKPCGKSETPRSPGPDYSHSQPSNSSSRHGNGHSFNQPSSQGAPFNAPQPPMASMPCMPSQEQWSQMMQMAQMYPMMQCNPMMQYYNAMIPFMQPSGQPGQPGFPIFPGMSQPLPNPAAQLQGQTQQPVQNYYINAGGSVQVGANPTMVSRDSAPITEDDADALERFYNPEPEFPAESAGACGAQQGNHDYQSSIEKGTSDMEFYDPHHYADKSSSEVPMYRCDLEKSPDRDLRFKADPQWQSVFKKKTPVENQSTILPEDGQLPGDSLFHDNGGSSTTSSLQTCASSSESLSTCPAQPNKFNIDCSSPTSLKPAAPQKYYTAHNQAQLLCPASKNRPWPVQEAQSGTPTGKFSRVESGKGPSTNADQSQNPRDRFIEQALEAIKLEDSADVPTSISSSVPSSIPSPRGPSESEDKSMSYFNRGVARELGIDLRPGFDVKTGFTGVDLEDDQTLIKESASGPSDHYNSKENNSDSHC